MHFERLLGRRIVPHLLALFHLPVTCHQSGHIPSPAESSGGWPLSSTSIRHSPPAESLGNQAGRLTLTFPELLGPSSPYDVAQRMPLSSALRFLGVWSGPMALAGSRPVYVCLQTKYGLNSGVFLSTLLHMPYPNRGVVWRSIQSVFTGLLLRLLLTFLPPRICASVCCVLSAHYRNMDCFSPPRGCESEYEGALSRGVHAFT